MEHESASDFDLGAVVDAMYHDVTHCESVELPEPRDIVVYGGNGYCEEIACELEGRLGRDYSVESLSEEQPDVSVGRYYLQASWYVQRYGRC